MVIKRLLLRPVCDELSVSDYQADMLPADKLAVLRRLQRGGGVVAMVGDGVNDAPVLAGADLSVALATGSELSQYHADVVLLNGDLNQLTRLYRVAQTTEKVTRQNLNWALFYNGLGPSFCSTRFPHALVGGAGNVLEFVASSTQCVANKAPNE